MLLPSVWNHSFFWHCLKPGGGGQPSGELAKQIDAAFGSYDKFVQEFSNAGATQFGSGWAWLVKDGGKLAVTKTPNARSEEHTSELQSLMRNSYAVFCLKHKKECK